MPARSRTTNGIEAAATERPRLMPVWLELSSRYAITVPTSSRRRAPSAPDVVAEWQHCQFARHAQEPRHTQLEMSRSCSVSRSDENLGRRRAQIKKPALKG